MSVINITYGVDLFAGIGPVPLVSVENQNVFQNNKMYTIDKVTLNGRIQRSDCQSYGFADPYQIANTLIGRLGRNFRQLGITETIEYTTSPIYQWEYAIVRSINFDDDKWYDWIPYTIEFDCYKYGYFLSDGIIDPTREVSIETLSDNTLNLTISCSCKGMNDLAQGIENARLFAFSNSGVLAADLINSFWIPDLIKTAVPYLISEVESINRLDGTVTITRTYVVQDPSIGFTRGVMKYTREVSSSEVGETTVTINGSHQADYNSDTTLLAIEDDIKGYDWFKIALEAYTAASDTGGYSDPTEAIKIKLHDKIASAATKNIWSTYDTSTYTFVRNPECWTNDLDLSGLIIAGTEPGYEGKKLGVAISPRHYLFAWHYKPPLATFEASISGTTMTVTSLAPGSIGLGVNQVLTATLITAGTKIVNQLTGAAGSTGTYTVNYTQTRASQTIKGNQRLYFLDNTGSVISRLVTDYLNDLDVAIGLLDSDLPSTVSFLKVLPPNESQYITLLGKSVLVRDKVTSGSAIHKSVVREIGTNIYVPEYNSTATVQAVEEPLSSFYEGTESGDSDSPIIAILDDELVLLGYAISPLGGMRDINYDVDSINSMMATLGGGYSLTYYYPKTYTNLFPTPSSFSLERNIDSNSLQFSISYSNKKDNGVYLIDETKIVNENEGAVKCIEVSVSIRSDLKCEKSRWNAVYNYYNSFDFVDYVQSKWEKYGNTDRLNFNVKDNSYAENKFEGSIDLSAKFCISLGQDCGCLQDISYNYSFVPPLKEYKVAIPINGKGCHYIEDLLLYKRASFSIKGGLIQPVCCTYEKTILELKNRINQLSNSLFWGEDKIIDSVEISNSDPVGQISFDFSWSAKKDPIIPESLL